MAFRFWRRFKIAPGVTLILSKSGGSLSFGPRGGKFTIGPRGRRTTVGLPGTGLFYTTTHNNRSKSNSSAAASGLPVVPAKDRLSMGFFKRLLTPDDEEAFVDGCRELALGNESRALAHLQDAAHLTDAAYLAGFLAINQGLLQDGVRYLESAAENHSRLGSLFAKYELALMMSLPITDEVIVHVAPDRRGVLLGLVEAYQRLEQWAEAVGCLETLRRLEPDDLVVKLSLAELLMEALPEHKDAWRKVVHLAEGVENETAIHAALMYYKGKALHRLGLLDAARDTLTAALRRRKDRPDALLQAIRYERARVYEAMGNHHGARQEFGKLYAQSPDYEDVATRLGLNERE